jgi:hypothetical protein
MGRSTMKKIDFVRTRPVTHGDLATLLGMLQERGFDVSPAHKASGDGYGAGGIAYTTTEPEHKYKYVRFTGADLPDLFTPGSAVVWGEYTEPVWTPSNRFNIEVRALGMNFGDTSDLCAAIKAAFGCMDLRDVKALKREANARERHMPRPPARAPALAPRHERVAAALVVIDAEGDMFGEGVRTPAPPAPPARARRAKPSREQRFKAAHAACEAHGDILAGWGAPAPDLAWAARQAAALEEIEAEGPLFG